MRQTLRTRYVKREGVKREHPITHHVSRITFHVAVSALLLAPLVCAAVDEFEWAWEDADKPPVNLAKSDVDADKGVAELGEGSFAWSWEEGEGDAAESEPPSAGADEDAGPAAEDSLTEITDTVAALEELDAEVVEPGLPDEEGEEIDVPVPESPEDPEPEVESPGSAAAGESYRELVEENLELRRKIAGLTQDEKAAKEENLRLSREVQDLEGRISEFVLLIEDINKEKAASAEDPDRMMDLEEELAAAESEKERLSKQMQGLQTRVEELQLRQVAEPAPAATAGVQPGSDLFREMENQNAELKEQLAKLESEHLKAEKARQRFQEENQKATEELAEVKSSEQQYRKTIETLMKHVPDMEREIKDLRVRVEEKDMALGSREKALETLRIELERREHRLIKAERMAAMMARAREDLQVASDKEKRDMHYNMAAVYAKEGRFREAEREYLRALRIDPADADVHYNLGILYDEELDQNRKAAMHYRRYLKLRPHAGDVDMVKDWLMRIEMDMRR